MSTTKRGDGLLFGHEALMYPLDHKPETREVQIIVHGGVVAAVHNWPEGLPGAVYDYDDDEAGTRHPVQQLTAHTTSPDHVLVNTGAFDWLIARAMNRPKGEN